MNHLGFEVNTDPAFIDPDWEVFEQQHDKRFGLAIAYMKELIQGQALNNAAMDLVVGEQGFYSQSRHFPAAFFGDTGKVTVESVDQASALAAAWEAVALYRSGEAQSLTCIYGNDNPNDVFFGYRFAEQERYELGHLRSGLPLHLRVMIDGSQGNELMSEPQGVFIYQQTAEGQHYLLRAPGRRLPFPLLDGFSE